MTKQERNTIALTLRAEISQQPTEETRQAVFDVVLSLSRGFRWYATRRAFIRTATDGKGQSAVTFGLKGATP